MGGGSYDPIASRSRSTTYYQNRSREEVFSQRHMDPQMNPKDVAYREARDSEEHPESFPIIIALDEIPYIAEADESFLSRFQVAVDTIFASKNIYLIILIIHNLLLFLLI